MEKWIKVTDFAELVGCSVKTVYKLINRGRLITGKELVNGREIVHIITNSEEIEKLQKHFGNNQVITGEYEESLSTNSGENVDNAEFMGVFVDKIMEMTKEYNNRLLLVNEELMNYKEKVPLLEYKANREGLYLNEINQLKANRKKVIVWLITFIALFVLTACAASILLVIEHNKPPKVITTEKVVEKIVEKPVYRYIKK